MNVLLNEDDERFLKNHIGKASALQLIERSEKYEKANEKQREKQIAKKISDNYTEILKQYELFKDNPLILRNIAKVGKKKLHMNLKA